MGDKQSMINIKSILDISKDSLDRINVAVQILLAIIALFALIYAILQYRLSKKRYKDDSRPYIFIDLERTNHGLLDLEISNTGKSAATDISIKFTPNIAIYEHDKSKINSFKFLKNLKFLASDKKFSFFFGSIIGGKTKICREFSVEISYKDVEGNKYDSKQVIDPRDFLGLVSLNRKTIHEASKTLEEIKKELKTNNDTNKKIVSSLESGLVSRDSVYASLDTKELLLLLKNKLTVGAEGVYNTFNIEKDAAIIASFARDKMLLKAKLSSKDKRVLKALNDFESTDYRFNTQGVVDKFLEVLK